MHEGLLKKIDCCFAIPECKGQGSRLDSIDGVKRDFKGYPVHPTPDQRHIHVVVTSESGKTYATRDSGYAVEPDLVETRLEALAAKVDPHFLFNALNTLGEVMHEDVDRAERLLASLGNLLRGTLEPGTPTWSLVREYRHTRDYVDLLVARFDDHLAVTWHLDEGVDDFRIPRFAIQTRVENAVKHNGDRTEPLHVSIDVTHSDHNVFVTVEDDGQGLGYETSKSPRGLARLEETISLIYGLRAHMERGQSARGGARVMLRIPERAHQR